MAKTLLVLGNGFDLKVGLESSFYQYLKSDYYKPVLDTVKNIYRIVEDKLHIYTVPYTNEMPQELLNLFKEISFWDLYYTIPHVIDLPDRDYWYAFEDRLYTFLMGIENDKNDYRNIKSATIQEARDRIRHGETGGSLVYDLVLKTYLDYCVSPDKHGIRNYSDKLLEDLKRYEVRFGNYIAEQQAKLKEYNSRAERLIGELLTKGDELVYINTFNYSSLQKAKTDQCDIWHVNGDTQHPIFGIDYSESRSVDSKCFHFSKTYRRLELEGNSLYYPKRKEFAKVVVFGHSLNRQDYNYFYALFNQLNLSNDRGKRNGYTVEFAYSGYSGKTPEEARRDTIGNVLKLMKGYNSEVLHEEHFRLMDILYCNGAVKFKEIPQ